MGYNQNFAGAIWNSHVQPKCETNTDRAKDNRDRCSYNFIISSVCGTPRRLAFAEHRSALINIPLGQTRPMTSLLLKYACKPPPPTQGALQQLWEEEWKSVGLPQVPDIQLLLWLKTPYSASNSPSVIQKHAQVSSNSPSVLSDAHTRPSRHFAAKSCIKKKAKKRVKVKQQPA